MTDLPTRRYPAHVPPVARVYRSTILFVTACVQRRRGILANDDVHNLVRTKWAQADHWLVGRYMIMPDHVHFFCAPGAVEREIKGWMSYWRNQVTREWPEPTQKPIWQSDFWDTQMRNLEHYAAKWEYVRQNPVRAGLVAETDDWSYQGELNLLQWIGP